MPTIDLKPLVLECIDFYINGPYSPSRSALLRELEGDLALAVYAESNDEDSPGYDPDQGPQLVIMLCSIDDYSSQVHMFQTETGLVYLLKRYAVGDLHEYGACRIDFTELDALTDFDVVLTPRRANCREYPDFLKLTQYMTLTKPVPAPEPVAIDTLL